MQLQRLVLHINLWTLQVRWTRQGASSSRNIIEQSSIAPTADALLNHLKKTMLQCHVWVNCLQLFVPRLDPCRWGWKKNVERNTSPYGLQERLQELTVACKSLYTSHCRCMKNALHYFVNARKNVGNRLWLWLWKYWNINFIYLFNQSYKFLRSLAPRKLLT